MTVPVTDTASPNLGPNVVNGVLVTVAVPGSCLTGVCAPRDSNTLGLITVRNTGSASPSIQMCDTVPWLFGSPYIANLPAGAGTLITLHLTGPCTSFPIKVLAPGDSIRVNAYFPRGSWWVNAFVATSATSQSAATSAIFTVQ